MKPRALIVLAGIMLLALGAYHVSGCGGSSTGLYPYPTISYGILYVANTGNNAILSFRRATYVNGNATPNTNLAGASTTISGPTHIFVDRTNDRIFIANTTANSVLIYDHASKATGNTAPSRTLAGATTNLNLPGGIFVDTSNNFLYVANAGGNSITVYNNASTVKGDTAPSREITGLNNTPGGLGVDTRRNILYCALTGTNSVAVWTLAAQVNGATPPTRTITGLNTLLNAPDGIYMDIATDRLYVANPGGNCITVYETASMANGNIAPNRTLIGANTLLNSPRDVTIDSTYDWMLIANQGDNSISIFNQASTVSGNTAPNRRIIGNATTLNGPTGIFVDMTRSGQ